MRFHSMFFVAGLFGFGAVLPWSDASAKDLEILTRLLIPAYMAQDFTALCATQNSDFLSELKYGAAAISVYAEHVKREITVDVAENEAAKIRVTAADTAQQVARHELHLLIERQTADPANSLKKWCDQSAKPFILEILNKHQEKHLEYDDIVRNAKR